MARKKATATPSKPALSYGERQALLVEKFLDGDGWDTIYRTWKRRVEEFAVPLDPLFMDIPIHDKTGKYVGGQKQDWWCHSNIEDHRARIIEGLNRDYVLMSLLDPNYRLTKSIGQTVQHLWAHHAEPETVAAIMIAGSIFRRIHGRGRGRLPDDWPSYDCLLAVERVANERWNGEPSSGWAHYHSDPFPANQANDEEYGIKSLKGLVEYFAVEHAATLLVCRLVNVRFIEREKPVK
jgi:hypothetical protein